MPYKRTLLYCQPFPRPRPTLRGLIPGTDLMKFGQTLRQRSIPAWSHCMSRSLLCVVGMRLTDNR